MPNRLARARSPYLQQHQDNPVDWYEWGPEALEKARREDKPILLSIGYAACHWCHVMAHESFEDEATARLMNEHFVNIKVDREERPDLDQIYQLAVQILGRHGGWPLTVFLTPTLEPFYGGTYFPPTDRYGMPAFTRVLADVAGAYRARRADVESHARALTAALAEVAAQEESGERAVGPGGERAQGLLDGSLVVEGARALLARYDEEHGGFGTRPKFPNTMALELLLRASRRGVDGARRAVFHTLERMAQGGIYDQLGGGFARYSTDERWLVPHFEKMLYDNALLPRIYLAAWQVAEGAEEKALFARVARETLEWIRREMTHPRGGFYSSLDADSEGEEGKYYVWDEREIAALLGAREAAIVCRAYGVVPGGNFERTGKSVLSRPLPLETVARLESAAPEEVERILAEGRRKLLAARERRVRPFRDEKVIAAWNGLGISAFAESAAVLGEGEHLSVATAAADFLRAELWKVGRLARAWKDGAGAGGEGYLDDYAFVAAGLVDLFSVGGRPEDLDWAEELAGLAVERFSAADGGFFLSAVDAEPLIQRPRSAYDQMIPSGAGVLVDVLLKLHALTGEGRWYARAERALVALAGAARKNPFGFGQALCAADALAEGVTSVVVVGPRMETETLWRAAWRPYSPNKVVVRWDGAGAPPPALAGLLGGKGGRAAAYLCRRGTCSAPIEEPAELARALAAP